MTRAIGDTRHELVAERLPERAHALDLLEPAPAPADAAQA